MSIRHNSDKKPHVCPPSTATHPRDRWESLFVYSFVCKFTNLRGKEGLETPMDLEEAVMAREPHPILTQLLVHFILNLKPQTRNLSTDQISTTVASVLSEYFKSSERTIFWDHELNANVDPFEGLEGGFFATNWDFKLKILRQLVELQLVHGPSIKTTIDRAWGVVHNKHKKKDTLETKLDPTDPKSQERLQLNPIGQDNSRKRYWIADDSPRVYVSTNPWKTTATFQTVCSTREEYVALIEELKKDTPPPPKRGQKRTKMDLGHIALTETLEGRIEQIDAELVRVAKVRKKIEQRRILLAQAELRETRTRRRAQKPDYVYTNDFDSEDDADEYRYQEDGEFEDEDFLNGSRKRGHPSTVATRRSNRSTATNKPRRDESPAESWKNWRGERRSTRLGAPNETQFEDEPVPKRARTEESTISVALSMDEASSSGTNGLKFHVSGAAALKPTEIAVEQIAGKKKSKFWVYAVEPIPGAAPMETDSLSTNGTDTSADLNGRGAPHANGNKNGVVMADTNGVSVAKASHSPKLNGGGASQHDQEPTMDLGSLLPMAVDNA